MNDFYHTIENAARTQFLEKGSRFIAYASPIGDLRDFKQQMQQVKREHPKATHHCYAYRLGFDGNDYRANDDGEPMGSAGRPILGQIDSRKVTNTLVIVVRYFGGTQLGVPGLIQAYRSSASLVLQLTPVLRKPIMSRYRLEFDYTKMNDIMQIVKKYSGTVLYQDNLLFCRMELAIPRVSEEQALMRLNQLPLFEIKPV